MWLFMENKKENIAFSCIMDNFKCVESGEMVDTSCYGEVDIYAIKSINGLKITVELCNADFISGSGILKELEIVTDTADGHGTNTVTNEEYYGMVVPLGQLQNKDFIITNIEV